MQLKLIRLDETDQGTPGLLTVDGRLLCYTLERKWADNAKGVSCIPIGNYKLERGHSPRFNRELYEVMGVPNRDRILFHSLNLAIESNGCIGVGLNFGTYRGQFAVLKSKAAELILHDVLDSETSNTLTIVNISEDKFK
jgi:hypothetical protein